MILCKVNSQRILQVFTKTTELKVLFWLGLTNGKLFFFFFGALFMGMSKAFNTLDHSLLFAKFLLFAKLSECCFDNCSLSVVQSYLRSRFQRCKIENDFSNWRETTTGVPQGSILGPLPFNIFINDIFLFAERSNDCNYADDNTSFAFGKTFDEVTRKLQNDCLILGKWFLNTSFC